MPRAKRPVETVASRPTRTDPHLQNTEMCKFYMHGRCTRGQACTFAHGRVELRDKPDFYHTRLCAEFVNTGVCSMGSRCRYAHSEHQIRPAGISNNVNGVYDEEVYEDGDEDFNAYSFGQSGSDSFGPIEPGSEISEPEPLSGNDAASLRQQIHLVQQHALMLREHLQALRISAESATHDVLRGPESIPIAGLLSHDNPWSGKTTGLPAHDPWGALDVKADMPKFPMSVNLPKPPGISFAMSELPFTIDDVPLEAAYSPPLPAFIRQHGLVL